jgi:hypothetical protein
VHASRVIARALSRFLFAAMAAFVAASASAADPSTLSVVSGVQTVVAGQPFPEPIVARLVRPGGAPVAGATITFSARMSQPGILDPAQAFALTAVTDATGTASVVPRAPFTVGSGFLTVSVLDSASGTQLTTTSQFLVRNERGGVSLSFQDLWWGGPRAAGWGVSITQHRQQLFNVFFVYDDAGNPTWYVQPQPQWHAFYGTELVDSLYSPHGTPWFAYNAAKFSVGPAAGTVQYTFRSERDATFRATFGSSGPIIFGGGAPMSLQRQPFGRNEPAPIEGVGDLWWGGIEQNGWGVAIAEQGGTLFIVWFTYDEEGAPTWFVMPGGEWGGDPTYSGTIYRTRAVHVTSPVPYDPSQLRVTPVGEFSLHFADRDHATLAVEIEGRRISLALVRQPF